MVALAASHDLSVTNMVMVSPPVGIGKFESNAAIPSLKLVITGSRDDIAPASEIAKMLPKWNPDARLEIVEDADHFYAGCFGEIESILLSNI